MTKTDGANKLYKFSLTTHRCDELNAIFECSEEHLKKQIGRTLTADEPFGKYSTFSFTFAEEMVEEVKVPKELLPHLPQVLKLIRELGVSLGNFDFHGAVEQADELAEDELYAKQEAQDAMDAEDDS